MNEVEYILAFMLCYVLLFLNERLRLRCDSESTSLNNGYYISDNFFLAMNNKF